MALLAPLALTLSRSRALYGALCGTIDGYSISVPGPLTDRYCILASCRCWSWLKTLGGESITAQLVVVVKIDPVEFGETLTM